MSEKFVLSPFDAIRRYDKIGDEYWSARDLQGLLGYAKWQKFQDAIERAKMACKNSGQDPELNFTRSGKPIITGKGRRQNAVDYHRLGTCQQLTLPLLIGSTLKLMRMAIKWRARGCASKK